MKRVMFVSTVLLIIFAMTTMFSIAGCKAEVAAEEVAAEEVAAEEAAVPTAGYYSSEKETYYMVTFVNGHPYWVGCYKGAQAAAANLGNVEVKFGGTPEYDINEAVTSFEQIVAIKPEGILLACMNPEPFIEPINNAMADGIPIVTYDTDSPNSNRLAYASTDNVYLGEQVFDYIVNEVMGSDQFKIGIMCRPGQLNLEQRIEGFKKRAVNYPGVEIVAEVDGEGDVLKCATAASAMIAANPDIGIIWSTDSMGGPGAAQACEELGREDIKIMCVD